MMRSILFFSLLLSFFSPAFSQQTYTTAEDDTHYCGPVTEAQLRTGEFAEWFSQTDPDFELPTTIPEWANALTDSKVDIYLGTWCGDSKRWVPRFVNYWKAIGLNPDQLNFVALYNGTEKYKQGPNGEEKGKCIHRVPTFIFSREGEEFARVVEHPVTDLQTDLAQIAMGYPPRPAYPAANALWAMLDAQPTDSIYAHARTNLRKIHRLSGRSSELNTLGYVLLQAGETEKAETVLHFNTLLHKYDPNTHDSYGEVLAIAGKHEAALKAYEKALSIDPELGTALTQVAALKLKIKNEGGAAGAKGED